MNVLVVIAQQLDSLGQLIELALRKKSACFHLIHALTLNLFAEITTINTQNYACSSQSNAQAIINSGEAQKFDQAI